MKWRKISPIPVGSCSECHRCMISNNRCHCSANKKNGLYLQLLVVPTSVAQSCKSQGTHWHTILFKTRILPLLIFFRLSKYTQNFQKILKTSLNKIRKVSSYAFMQIGKLKNMTTTQKLPRGGEKEKGMWEAELRKYQRWKRLCLDFFLPRLSGGVFNPLSFEWLHGRWQVQTHSTVKTKDMPYFVERQEKRNRHHRHIPQQ